MVHPKALFLFIYLFYFFAMGHLIGLSPKNIMNPPLSPSKNYIFYIVFHGYVKPYKCICFILTLFYMAT